VHFAKHVKGVILRSNGVALPKPGGADMPEFTSFSTYRSTARSFFDPTPSPGVLQGYRADGDLLRVDPSTGYFGVLSPNGTIRTFFRPDGDPVAYFRSQF